MKKPQQVSPHAVSTSRLSRIFSALTSGRNGNFTGSDYTIPEIDLSVMPPNLSEQYRYLYELTTVDDSRDYVAHPDSVLLHSGEILTVYPAGHGKGAIQNRISVDGGRTYTKTLPATPESWKNSLETPTIYRLEFTDGTEKLLLSSANSKWPGMSTPGGFNCSISCDEGQTWTEFETFYDKRSSHPVIPIVAMASLTRLKENGKFADKWMGLFHDAKLRNYKTILTFDRDGKMHWSVPERYFAPYRAIERRSKMCEVEVIRSDGGQGDELALLTRSNSKKINSLISFSTDEGETWTPPRELPAALNGERLKAEYLPDGRLFIDFRSIERGPKAAASTQSKVDRRHGWISEGWVAWVGTYDDLKNGTEGQYRIKLAHTYIHGQREPAYTAHADTGYCGNVVLPDGTIVASTYGCFDPHRLTEDGSLYRTYIASKRIRLGDVEAVMRDVLGITLK